MTRVVLVALLLLAAGPGRALAEEVATPPPVVAECMPTAQAWYLPPGSAEIYSQPDLSVVDTDLRPGHARLYLDGRFIGLADDFDGFPDYLYLRSGSYRLEVRLGGYETVAFSIHAEPGCAFGLRLRLERIPGTPKVRWWDEPEEAAPGARFFGPVQSASAAPPGAPPVPPAPDVALRPDLPRPGGREVGPGMRLAVSPLEAAIYLDGTFLGLARELDRRSRPVPLSAGLHRLEVMAPGHATHRRDLEVAPGEVLEVVVVLEPE